MRRLTKQHRRILEILKKHRVQGITQVELARLMGSKHSQVDRRRRELRRYYDIETRRVKVTVPNGKPLTEYRYFYHGPRNEEPLDDTPISQRLRAAVLFQARGRCGMCGRTIEDDGIKLVIDHRIPRDWGGSTDEGNLWATCEECNQGKKDHFATVDDALMRKLFRHGSVHVRIGELLKAFDGKPVPATLIELVADQDDWMKRTRELRYLGWKIRASRSKERGRIRSFYAVERWEDWPPDPTLVIRKYELDRARRNRTNE